MPDRSLRRPIAAVVLLSAAGLIGCAHNAAPIAQQPRSVRQLHRIAERVNADAPEYTLGSGDSIGWQIHSIYARETLAASH